MDVPGGGPNNFKEEGKYQIHTKFELGTLASKVVKLKRDLC